MVKIKYIFQAWGNTYLKCLSPDKYVYGWIILAVGLPGFVTGLWIGTFFHIIIGILLAFVFYIFLSGIVAYYMQMRGWF